MGAAVALAGLLAACGGHPVHPRSETPVESPRDSSEAVLVLKFLPGGRVEQSWQPPYPYAKKGGREHVDFCRTECRKLYEDCLRLEGLLPLKFEATDTAAGWLKEHREGLMTGGLILIAGTTFVMLVLGPEVLVLAPLVLVP